MTTISTDENLEVREDGIFDQEENKIIGDEKIEEAYINAVNSEVSACRDLIHSTVLGLENSDSYFEMEVIPESLTEETEMEFFYVRLYDDGESVVLYGDIFCEALDFYLGMDSPHVFKRIARENMIKIGVESCKNHIVLNNMLIDKEVKLSKKKLKESIFKIICDGDFMVNINEEHYVIGNRVKENYVIKCFMCDEIKDDTKYIQIFETTPFCICRECIGDFMNKYLNCNTEEIIARTI